MLDLSSKLCGTCQGFDVRDALLKAEQGTAVSAGRSHELVRPGLKRYYAHHSDLLCLRECAVSGLCDLCATIWHSYISVNYPTEATISDKELQRGVGSQPIYIGTDDWNISREGVPQVAILQHDTAAATPAITRKLACFDVCAPYG